MQPPVFLADREALASDVVVLSGAEGRHAATVRRLRPGERADVTDGACLVAECVVAGPADGGLGLTVQARREVPRPDPAITVVQAIPKGDRGELAVEEMTEVGVDRIVPWAAARCISVWRGARGERSLARWRLTAREAAKQSRRAWIPEVTDVASAALVAQLIGKAACAIVLEPRRGQPRPPQPAGIRRSAGGGGPGGRDHQRRRRGLPRGRGDRVPPRAYRAADLDRRDRGRRHPAHQLRSLVLAARA